MQSTVSYYGNEYYFGKSNITNLIENNLKMYYDWSFLKIGGWTDVSIPTNQINSFDLSRLQPIEDPHYKLGQVWEAPRRDFIYEKNVNYFDYQGNLKNPFIIENPYINSIPKYTGYYINYPFGQIVFEDPIDIKSIVQIKYSYRNVQFQKAGDLSWWRQLQFYSAGFTNNVLKKLRDNEWSIFGQKFQLPMVIIETSMADSEGWELGTNNRRAIRKVNFYIYSESAFERNNLMDIINLQSDVRIPFLDLNKISIYNDFQLNYRGELNNNLQYPDLVEKYKYRMCHMKDSTITNISRINPILYTATVQTNIDVII